MRPPSLFIVTAVVMLGRNCDQCTYLSFLIMVYIYEYFVVIRLWYKNNSFPSHCSRSPFFSITPKPLKNVLRTFFQCQKYFFLAKLAIGLLLVLSDLKKCFSFDLFNFDGYFFDLLCQSKKFIWINVVLFHCILSIYFEIQIRFSLARDLNRLKENQKWWLSSICWEIILFEILLVKR